MTRKQSLYASAPGVALLGTLIAIAPAGAQERPPCGSCLSVAAHPSALPPGTPTGALALVVRPGELEDLKDARLDVLAARAVLLEPDGTGTGEARAFAARRLLADLRGRFPSARLGIVGAARLLDDLLEHELAPYLDLVVAPEPGTATRERWERAYPGLRIWKAAPLGAFDDLLAASTEAADGGLLIWPPPPITLGLLEDLRQLAELLPEGLVRAADGPAQCHPAEACRIDAYQRADTRETMLVVRRVAGAHAALVAPAQARDLWAIGAAEAGGPDRRGVRPLVPALPDAAGLARFEWPPGVTAVLLRLPPDERGIVEDVRVLGARQLTAAEIVARHQAAAARQTHRVRELVTHARSTVTFEIPAFPAPVTVQAETTLFQGSAPTELVQRQIRVNGVAFTSNGVPRLPIIEPERVAAPPLAITLTRAYQYTRAGRETLRGRETYVIAFVPTAEAVGESLFSGRAWIDRATFALLRVDAVQTNLRGPITSSQQIEDFREEAIEGEPVWLLDRSELRQIYQGAGLTTPVHRVMVVDRHEINPLDMEARRRAAYASSDIMLRETPGGLRYLQRTPAHDEAAASRVIAGRATRVRTLAGGIIVDPNITRLLPFAGVNYTDFDLLGSGAQLNAFFGGAYGQVAFSAPSLGGTRWQLRGAGFAMLARYNDRAFRDGRERYEENIRQRPAHTSIGVTRPLTSRTALHAAYLFDYIGLSEGDTTAPSFIVPSDLVVHGARLALETQRAGWRMEGWWSPARRAGWRAWGRPDGSDYRARDASFQRFGVSAARPWVIGPRALLRAEAAWMGGHDLDRFSRYSFGTFENRLRGYPSASIRYDRGAVLRTAAVWQPPGRVRLDLFGDAALVRDPGFGTAYRGYPGFGAAVEAPGPFGLLLGAEWGYGIRGLNRDGTRGTHVIRVTAYKIF
jgi:hypothetical protein